MLLNYRKRESREEETEKKGDANDCVAVLLPNAAQVRGDY
jgi:hypothetical protein